MIALVSVQSRDWPLAVSTVGKINSPMSITRAGYLHSAVHGNGFIDVHTTPVEYVKKKWDDYVLIALY